MSYAKAGRRAHLRAAVSLCLALAATAASSATITVDSAVDFDASACTLRSAIAAADANAPREGCAAGQAPPVVDTIAFAIPPLDGGVRTITLANPYGILEPVVVDGLTQPGSACLPLASGGPQPRIELRPAGAVAVALGLIGRGVTLRGLAIDGFTQAQVRIAPAAPQFGRNRIQCSVIGMDAAGFDGGAPLAPDTVTLGIEIIEGDDNVIGTDGDGVADALEGNLIAGSTSNIALFGFIGLEAQRNRIAGNWIGLDRNGSAAPTGVAQRDGVLLGGSAVDTLVGSDFDGVSDAEEANRIGFMVAPAESSRPGTGVAVIDSARGNRITGNSITNNQGLAIDIGTQGAVQPNDVGDADTGANELQNYPTLRIAVERPGAVTASGTLDGAPSATYTIDLYGSADCDASGNGEAAFPLGRAAVTTDATGSARFALAFGRELRAAWVSATATDASGNTSELSACSALVLLRDGFENPD